MFYEKIVADWAQYPIDQWIIVGALLLIIAIYVVIGLTRPRETPAAEKLDLDFSDQGPDNPDWF